MSKKEDGIYIEHYYFNVADPFLALGYSTYWLKDGEKVEHRRYDFSQGVFLYDLIYDLLLQGIRIHNK